MGRPVEAGRILNALSLRIAGVLLAGIASLAVLAGCGGSSGTPAAAAPSPAAAASAFSGPNISTIVTATGRAVDIYRSPTATTSSGQLSNPNADGAKRVFLAVAKLPGWWQVMLPVQPNGSIGWVKADQVVASTTGYHLVLARSAHQLKLYNQAQLVTTIPVAVGTADTPTPGGRYFLMELLKAPNPNGVYGPYAFGLSGFSASLSTFDGGPPIIGLHGTNQPNLIGTDVSHGCIRMSNDNITRLAQMLPLGTPIEIRA
jgi:lipoprotein-anchoring transpeptidase ErfK/SrfK